MEWVSFPGIGIGKIYISRSAFKFFGIDVFWYGIIICLGIMLAVCFCYFMSGRLGVFKCDILPVASVGLIFGIFGARLFYVIFTFDSFSGDIFRVFKLRDGGFAVYGGIVLSIVFGSIFCKIKKVKLLPFLDLASFGFLIGQAVGRWGNFFNIEAYGCKTTLPFGMSSSAIQAAVQPVHPTFLYESLWCVAGFLFLRVIFSFRKFDGQLFLTYMAWYGFGRFFIEGLRTDSLWLVKDFLKISQVLAFIFFVTSVATISYMLLFYVKRHAGICFLWVNSAEYRRLKKQNSLLKNCKR